MLLTKYGSGDQIKNVTCVGKKTGFWWENVRKRDHLDSQAYMEG